MAKYTFESIMYGEKYNIESDVFMAAYELVKQGVKPTNIREQLREFYVREAIKTTIKMIKEGDSISDIPEFESLSLREDEILCKCLKNSGMGTYNQTKGMVIET